MVVFACFCICVSEKNASIALTRIFERDRFGPQNHQVCLFLACQEKFDSSGNLLDDFSKAEEGFSCPSAGEGAFNSCLIDTAHVLKACRPCPANTLFAPNASYAMWRAW